MNAPGLGAVPPAALLAWANAAPVALAAVDPAGIVTWINTAFETLFATTRERVSGSAIDTLLGDAATPWQWPPAGQLVRRRLLRADGSALACDLQCDDTGAGLRLLTFVSRDAEPALDAEIRRLAALLEFVQTVAGIGMWERSVRTQEGRWDPHMFRFFDVDPRHGTPSITQLTQASMPRDGLYQALTESMKKPGRYAHRYRLLTAAGKLRRIQTHWEVFADAQGAPDHMVGLVMDDTEAFALASNIADDSVQFQLATELSGVSMWRHDLVANRIYFNARVFEMIGLAPRPEGMDIADFVALIHPDDLPEAVATYDRALASGRPEDMQVRYRHLDGSWRHILTRRVVQRDSLGAPVALNGVAMDLTDQVERTRRADELARRLDDVTATSGIGVWRTLRDDGAAEWNAQMYTLSGLPPDERAPGFKEWVARFVHPDDRERVLDYGLAFVERPDGASEIAHRIVRTDGQVRHVVARSRLEPPESPYRATGVAIDVTERELALAALREATERSAVATRAAGLGIWEWDSDSALSRWDEEMFVLRGLMPRSTSPTLEEMSQWVHVDDRHFVNDQILSARLEDRPAYYEFRIVRPDGAVRWLASRSLPMRDEHGRTRLRLGVNWDVTEAREAAAARHERALVLRESQAKSELLARMSHELRTPLNAVLGFTQLLLGDETASADDDAAALAARVMRLARLEHIRSAGEHLLTLIDNVLEVSRLDGRERDLDMRPVALVATIAQALALVEGLAQKSGVTIIAPPTPLHVRADANRLKQVLVNLLTNAIKFNRPGGRVHLDASPERDRVLLRVSDDGMGMTAEQQELAFEPFNRAGAERERIEGTGIGLTIVKALVEGMGGSIAVHSAPGVGSVFDVFLAAAAASGPLALPARRLLYIEDNEVNVMIVSELVRRRGNIEFDSAPDGASGVERALQQLPGLVLVDMQLPDIDGLEVLARLRANPASAALRIVALSANAVPADIEQALQSGFDDYWTKPLDFAVFNAAMERFFGAPLAPNGPAA